MKPLIVIMYTVFKYKSIFRWFFFKFRAEYNIRCMIGLFFLDFCYYEQIRIKLWHRSILPFCLCKYLLVLILMCQWIINIFVYLLLYFTTWAVRMQFTNDYEIRKLLPTRTISTTPLVNLHAFPCRHIYYNFQNI